MFRDLLTTFYISACLYRQGSSPYWPSDLPAGTTGSHRSSAPGALPYKLYSRSSEEVAAQGCSMLKLAQEGAMHYCCSHCNSPALHPTPQWLLSPFLLTMYKQMLHAHLHVLHIRALLHAGPQASPTITAVRSEALTASTVSVRALLHLPLLVACWLLTPRQLYSSLLSI